MDELKKAFDHIRSDDALRVGTLAYVEKHRHQPQRFRRIAVAAACSLLLLVTGAWLYFTPTAQISIDLDGPLTLEVNRFDRVISASGSGSQTILGNMELTHLTYSDAMDQILSSSTVTEQLSSGEIMTVSVIAPEGEQSARLLTESQACTDATCYYADPETVETAACLGLSPGKYRALQELQELDPSITAEDIQGLSMRQVRAMLEDLLQQQEPPKDPANPPPKPPADEPAGPGQHGNGDDPGKGNGNGQGNGKKPGGQGGTGPKHSP